MTSTTLQLSETGRTIGLRDHGSGAPVVLIHGVGMQSAAWHPQIDALSRDYRVLALDMPGHGASEPLPDGSLLPDFVAWAVDAIHALNVGPVSLAGHSMGALIATGVAVVAPDSVTRVALLNGVFRRTKQARDAVMARADDIRAGQLDLDTPLKRWFGASATDQAARAEVARWLGSVNQAGYATAYGAFARGDDVYADRMNEITCPFLALTGSDDPNSTPEMSQHMAGIVQNGQSVSVPNQRHMVNLTAPDEVNKHLRSWLTQPARVTA